MKGSRSVVGETIKFYFNLLFNTMRAARITSSGEAGICQSSRTGIGIDTSMSYMMFLSFTFLLFRKDWDTSFFTSLLFHFIYNDTYWDGLLEDAARRFEMNVVTKSDTWTHHTYLDIFDYS